MGESVDYILVLEKRIKELEVVAEAAQSLVRAYDDMEMAGGLVSYVDELEIALKPAGYLKT